MTFDTQDLKLEYDKRHSDLVRLLEHVKLLIQQELEKKKMKFHAIESRVKPFNSFQDKIHRKNIENPFEEMHDLAALRIVCLYLTDLDIIRNLVKKNFDVIKEDNKIIGTKLNVFEYMSWHYDVKLRKPISINSLKEIGGATFEIQVRTVAQDAWASISKHLDHKQDGSFSEKSERDFYALSGLFFVADTHFLMLKKEKEAIFNKKLKEKQKG